MRRRPLGLCLAAALLIVCRAAQAQVAPASGFTTESITYQRADRSIATLAVAIWYPTDSDAGWYRYPYIWGQVAENAPPKRGRWPLVIHSHGLNECAVASAFLNEALARAGYIVAAVDHDDAANCLIGGGRRTYTSWNPLLPISWNFRFRPDDMRALLDALLTSPSWGPLIDPARIAASGHSLGGWTILALDDSRIRARLLWAPTYHERGRFYADVPGPKAFLFGEEHSPYLSPVLRTWAYDWSSSPKFLGYVADAGHYSFTDKPCGLLSTVECASGTTQTAILDASRSCLDFYVRGAGMAYLGLLNPGSAYLMWACKP